MSTRADAQGDEMSPRAGSSRRLRGHWRRRALWLVAGGAGLVATLLLVATILPMPSTLMLWRLASGQSVTRVWVPLERMSPELVRAVIASEDQRFCRHWGIDWGALREVLGDEDGPQRGGSTIAMQTVKNLYLWHGRSYVRKGIELPLALLADLVWSKRRMIELYLNVAEFGEGLFGVEAASQRYFNRSAASLARREAASLAASLPNPRLRNPAMPSQRARTNSFRIQQRMAGLGDKASCVLGRS
ncbi:MAG: monofunctional biosynthetic peptidoglycan transglycosylase [Beijerinckiaceae bacterium]|nr:monofunctional biosynthetic peptidoglycan transglycosylase [Beijerinckiaceae bacterium]